MTDVNTPGSGPPESPRAIPAPNTSPAAAALQAETRRTHSLARLVLAAFLFTFVIARILVILIMARKLPSQLFLHTEGTHVHHLNYGITLISIVGAYLIFARPTGKRLSVAAVFYGIGLALTFDEFGMWLHLGGLYWQRASFDAVITVAAALALLAYGSLLPRWRPHHHLALVLVLAVLTFFGVLLFKTMDWATDSLGPVLYNLETQGPS